MVLDIESINKHLELLRKFVRDLINSKETCNLQFFLNNSEKQNSILFAILQSLQNSLDIGNHIISEIETKRAESAREVFEILAENGIISKEVSSAMLKMCVVRNKIVHAYGGVNMADIYNDLEKIINYFSDFEKEIVVFLENQSL